MEGYVSGRLLRDRAERPAEAGARQADRGLEVIVESDEFKSFLKANGYTCDPKFGDDMKKELAGYDRKFRDVIKFLDDDK